MNYYMVVGDHYTFLRNAYEVVDDMHIILLVAVVSLILSQVVLQFFQLVS